MQEGLLTDRGKKSAARCWERDRYDNSFVSSGMSMILALIDGVTFQVALNTVDPDPTQLAKQTTDMILNGLVTNPTQALGHRENDDG